MSLIADMSLDKQCAFHDQLSENKISVTNFSTEKCPKTEENDEEKKLYYLIKLTQNFRISICKPLITLKLVLFFYHGAGSIVGPFFTLFLNQRGISLGIISIALTLSPVAGFFATFISGVTADKIGKSKPIFIFNLIFTISILISLLCLPSVKLSDCEFQPMSLKCHPQQLGRLKTKTICEKSNTKIKSCDFQCSENAAEHCNDQNLVCNITTGQEKARDLSLSIQVNGSSEWENRCYYNVSYMSHENGTYTWCDVHQTMYCRVFCAEKCPEQSTERKILKFAYIILCILFMATNSNGYRILDVTAMTLVKEHNSDFGRERLFSIAGLLIISPLGGYTIQLTTPLGGEKNYSSAFYLFILALLLVLVFVYKLDVTIQPPGEQMFKKSIKLLKNPDILLFFVIVLVLGTAFSFTNVFLYWYLEEMKTPSTLMGFIPAVSALYGIPFLFTSKWWIAKLGPRLILILGLLGYAVNSLGYSYLNNPWLSLILEITKIFSYHLVWVAVVVHSHNLAPEGLVATAIAMAGSLHYHIGKSTGSMIGGLIMNNFGGRTAFRMIAAMCSTSVVMYALFLLIRHKYYKKKININGK